MDELPDVMGLKAAHTRRPNSESTGCNSDLLKVVFIKLYQIYHHSKYVFFVTSFSSARTLSECRIFSFFFYLDKEISSEIVFNELLLGKKISQEKMYLFGAGGGGGGIGSHFQ